MIDWRPARSDNPRRAASTRRHGAAPDVGGRALDAVRHSGHGDRDRAAHDAPPGRPQPTREVGMRERALAVVALAGLVAGAVLWLVGEPHWADVA